MVKKVFLVAVVAILYNATSLYAEVEVGTKLKKECLECHVSQNIPSEIIYRRYLLRYSSKETIREKISAYLTHPDPNESIMPPQFFTKFTIKEPVKLESERLKKRVEEYVELYDVSRKLFDASRN